MLDWIKSVWAKWKVQVSVVGGVLVVATAYGTCSVEPPDAAPAATTEETTTALPASSTETTDDSTTGTTTTTEGTTETTGDETTTETTTEQLKNRWQTGEKSAAFYKKTLTFENQGDILIKA